MAKNESKFPPTLAAKTSMQPIESYTGGIEGVKLTYSLATASVADAAEASAACERCPVRGKGIEAGRSRFQCRGMDREGQAQARLVDMQGGKDKLQDALKVAPPACGIQPYELWNDPKLTRLGRKR